MNTSEQKELYLLSARGKTNFAKQTAGMELIAELDRSKRIDCTFLEKKDVSFPLLYCEVHQIAVSRGYNFTRLLEEIAATPKENQIFAYLTDKDNGELRAMAAKATAQGLRVETRTRTKY